MKFMNDECVNMQSDDFALSQMEENLALRLVALYVGISNGKDFP